MIKSVTIIQAFLMVVVGFNTNQTHGQQKHKTMKLMQVNYELVVNVTPEKAWNVLANYGNVGSFHSSLKSSKSINGSNNKAKMDCERECIIPNGKKEIMVREKITEIIEGQYYTYDVYEWKNFPLKKMFITYGVKTNNEGETVIYQNSEYRLNPRFLTWPMKGKLRNGARESLIAYKHYMETGEKKVDNKILKKKYKTS